MGYETNVGSYQLLYEIELTGTPTLVIDLMDPVDLTELKEWDINWRSQNRRRDNVVVLDGLIRSDNQFEIRHKPDGAYELFAGSGVAYFPYNDWHKKVYVKGSGTALVKFVIGFSKRPNGG